MSKAYDIAHVLDALHTIPPDIPRDTWLKVGMAFHDVGGSHEDFDRWSAGAATYNANDCIATWRSFRPGKGIGAGTLFSIAREHGYIETRGPGQVRTCATSSKPSEKPRTPISAAEVWERCVQATNAHSYISQKNATGVPLDWLRVLPAGDSLCIAGESMAGALVVPVCRLDGTISCLQFITPPDVAERLKSKGKPSKLNLPGARIEGWHVVGNIKPTCVIYICEGIGAAWACWQATGDASVVCFGWGRVPAVSSQLRLQHPKAHLVLVPDVGKEQEATKIAASVSGFIVSMPDGWKENSDASDLAQTEGMDVLEALLNNAMEPPKPPPLLKPVTVADVFTNPAHPPQFVWDGYLPKGVVSLLGAHGGVGKSTIALMLSVSAALGRPLFEIETAQCKTLFVSLEDGTHIVRNRLARICQLWGIDPAALEGKLKIVDGTEYPELFVAENRSGGEVTATYSELYKVVQTEGAGLILIDNASDAFGGDEIQRRQVRAFIRALMEIASLTDCAVLLLAHVDKNTSRAAKAEGGEGYSGSTAWHNSVRSRLFMTRSQNGTLSIEHQKSNLGKCREQLTLEWPEGGLPQLVGINNWDDPSNPFIQRAQGRAADELAIKVLRMVAEFESRQQYCSTGITSHSHVYAVLKSEPAFKQLKLSKDDTKRIVDQCQRAKWIEPLEYRTPERKYKHRWTLTAEGRVFAGLSAPTAPRTEDGTSCNMAQGGAPTAPTGIGGAGEESALLGAALSAKPEEIENANGN